MAENGENEEINFSEDVGEQDSFADDGLAAEEQDTTEVGDGDADATGADEVEDPELEAIKARVREMEEEAEKLKEMQSEVDKQLNLSSSSLTSPTRLSQEEKLDADGRSVYVGNVDYGATAEELEAHFHGCGSINRVTILCDKFTGHPKGFAYIEFADKDSITTGQALDESLFRGRQIKVTPKRTNRPGFSCTDRPPRGRGGFRGRGRGGGYAGYNPRGRGRFRARRVMYYQPY